MGFDVEAHRFAGEPLDEPSGCLWAGQDHWGVGVPGHQALRPVITQHGCLLTYSSRASEVGNHGNQMPPTDLPGYRCYCGYRW
jgi:hypothetical protein